MSKAGWAARGKCVFAHFIMIGLYSVLGVTSLAQAEGFRNPFQGSAANGQGAAFSAQADDPSAIHYNPAGMTQIPRTQVDFGIFFVSQTIKYTSPSGVSARGDLGGAVGLPPPGWLYVSSRLKDHGIHSLGDLSIGLGVQSLFGFAIKYPQDGPFASSVTKATLPLLNIKPTLAYKLNDMLSIGLGADIFTFAGFLGEGQFERQFLGAGVIPGTAAGDRLEVRGSGTTAGLNASLLFTPFRNAMGKPLMNVGFVWRSQAVLPIKGELLANGGRVWDIETQLRFPEVYTAALAGWPIRNAEKEWKLEVDVDVARWRSVSNGDIQLVGGPVLPAPQKLTNTVGVGLGTEYRMLKIPELPGWEVALRAGYLHSAKAFTDFSFDPAIPDGPWNAYTLGIGFLCKSSGSWFGVIPCSSGAEGLLKGIKLDIHYHYLLYERRNVTGNANPAVDGNYRSYVHGGSFTMGFAF